MQRICIFCGSANGVSPVYVDAARRTGIALAHCGVELVYGGGRNGLMGVVADSVLEAGGRVIGVIPQMLIDRETGHRGLTQLHVVKSMPERKTLMIELSNGFVTLPGGLGTMDEFYEVVSLAQLELHQKPSALLNIEGYYDPLLALTERFIQDGFMKASQREEWIVSANPEALIEILVARMGQG